MTPSEQDWERAVGMVSKHVPASFASPAPYWLIDAIALALADERERTIEAFKESFRQIGHGGTASETCDAESGECSICAVLDCPERDPLHYHHDGCPSCDTEAPTNG